MPHIEHGDVQAPLGDYKTVDFEYEYPEGLDLKPGSADHEKIKNMILDFARESHNVMQNRFDSWNKTDAILTTYVSPTQAEKDLKAKSPRKPIDIVFPYSYAMLETLLTYVFVAFAQEPMFRYEGYSPEDTLGAMQLELVNNLHCVKNKVLLSLHTMIRDGFSYGMGVGAPGWKKWYGRRINKASLDYSAAGTEVSRPESWIGDEEVIFEGNSLRNIDPYSFLPDPSVGIHEQQEGEFVGWVVRDNLLSLLKEEETDDEMFNGKYLRHVTDKTSIYGEDKSQRDTRTGTSEQQKSGTRKNRIDVIHMYIDLIPKDYKLSERDSPQRWKFALAADAVLIEAAPMNYLHNLFPIAVMSPDFDGYSVTPLSRLEILEGLQTALDYLFNTHITNVRKAVNDMFLVDPMLVNIRDMKDPEPGKLIRLRRPAWGRGVKDVAMQFGVNDITRQNIGDSAYIVEWMERVMGTDPSTAGFLRKGGPERLTKSEFQGTRQGAVSRLERVARIIGLQAMMDLGYMFASHTQQYMTQDVYVKVIGRWTETLANQFAAQRSGAQLDASKRMKVSPWDVRVEYDTLVRDGSIPGGNFSEAWVQIFKIIATDPELRQGFDIFRIFSHIAIGLGAKNIEDFKRMGGLNSGNLNMRVLPDEQVANEANRGNLIPLGA
jgi:hypothetical protein